MMTHADSAPSATPASAVIGAYDICFDGADALILKNVTIELRAGEIVGLAGESGAGKTLLLEILAGLTRPLLGEVVCGGNVIACTDTPPPIGFLSQTSRLDERLRVWQWLEYRAALGDVSADAVWDKNPLRRFGLAAKREAVIYDLAVGERRLVDMAALFVQPLPAYALDMPLAQLGDRQRDCVHQALQDMAAAGVAIVVSDASVRTLHGWADRVACLTDGHLREGNA